MRYKISLVEEQGWCSNRKENGSGSKETHQRQTMFYSSLTPEGEDE